MTTPATLTREPYLIEAHDTLKAMLKYSVYREVFIKGIAAGRNRDRAAVEDAISRLAAVSERLVYCASIRDTTRNLEDAATLARAARIVRCCYVHLPAAQGAA